jgi:hypothetical protein
MYTVYTINQFISLEWTVLIFTVLYSSAFLTYEESFKKSLLIELRQWIEFHLFLFLLSITGPARGG